MSRTPTQAHSASRRTTASPRAAMAHRTEIQLALLVVGLLAWGYGQRVDDNRLATVGLAFFAAAFLLRFFRRRDTTPPPGE